MRLLHATTVPSTLHFLEGQASRLQDAGFEVAMLSSPGEELEDIARAEGVAAIGVPMSRSISPVADLVTLLRLVRVLRRARPQILHAHTPKAGLLVTVAGRLAGVPVCLYQIHGLRYTTTTGARRALLMTTERIACRFAHHVLAVSPSILDQAHADRLLPRGSGRVIGAGTVNGIDVDAFDPEHFRGPARAAREELGIPADAPVIGFIGRIAADKGLSELAAAWSVVRRSVPESHLVVIGDEETNDPVAPQTMDALRQDPRVHLLGHRADVRPYLAVMSILTLPSYREGFGQTLLEASAMDVATVGTDIPGITDAIAEGRTGLLVPARDADALAEQLLALLADPRRCAALGAEGRRRAVQEFDRRHLQEMFLEFYLEAAASAGIREAARRPAAADDALTAR